MTSRRIKVSYHEGDRFAVPLGAKGYAVGVVARKGNGGVVFGYFFGPLHPKLPSNEMTKTLRSNQAILIKRFGDLALIRGQWPLIGQSEHWSRVDWPLVTFGRMNALHKEDGKAWRVEYS